jgi:hypothetical protein
MSQKDHRGVLGGSCAIHIQFTRKSELPQCRKELTAYGTANESKISTDSAKEKALAYHYTTAKHSRAFRVQD